MMCYRYSWLTLVYAALLCGSLEANAADETKNEPRLRRKVASGGSPMFERPFANANTRKLDSSSGKGKGGGMMKGGKKSKRSKENLGYAPEIHLIKDISKAVYGELATYEAPPAIRAGSYLATTWWNCIAAYSPPTGPGNYKDSITKTPHEVPVLDSSFYTSNQRALCAAQASTTYSTLTIPGAVGPLVKALAHYDEPIEVETKLDSALTACGSDVECFRTVAAQNDYSPTIMGQIVALLIYQYSLTDGFNQLGTDRTDAGYTCTLNCRHYADTTGFVAPNDPLNLSGDSWAPLLEDDSKGFFFYQQHVTPHVGTKGAYRVLPESDRTTRLADAPPYSVDRTAEANTLLARMATLDDVKKVQVEIHDDKLLVGLNVLCSFITNVVKSGFNDTVFPPEKDDEILSYERSVHFADGYTISEYDAVLTAWREKVRYKKIRPPSVVKNWGDQNITTWAPYQGTITYPARDFESFIRVMPHAEYPSGSACIFVTNERYLQSYLETMGLGQIDFPIVFAPFPARSTKTEPGLTPKNDVILSYSTIHEFAWIAAESRLDGGIHFAAAVTAGRALCDGIGNIAVQELHKLY